MPSGSARALPVKAAAEALQATFAAASLARKELEAAAAELRLALAEFNPLFVGVAGWFAATYHAAGHEGRAAAVRPSRRRRGLLLQDASRAGRAPAAAAESGAGNRPEVGEKPLRHFAPLRQALRRLGGRSSAGREPSSAVVAGSQ